MDRRRPTCRYLYVGPLGVHDFRDHPDVVSEERKGHRRIHRLRIQMIRSHFCGATNLVVSSVVDLQ